MKINGSWDSVLREERLKMNDYGIATYLFEAMDRYRVG
jgi:hypothetical protein